MALFFTRRSYNKTRKTFTINPANHTRYISISGHKKPQGNWMGSTMPRDLWVQEVLAEVGNGSLAIFVHGYNTLQSDMLKRLGKMEAGLADHGFNGALIAFDWPSDGAKLRYARDLRDAKETATALVSDGIIPLLHARPKLKIHLIGHSLGAYLIIRALSRFGDGHQIAGKPWSLAEIAFIAADVDQSRLEKGTSAALTLNHRARRLSNYYSTIDEVLWGARLFNGNRARLGRAGLPQPRFDSHVDVYGTEQFRSKVLNSIQQDIIVTHSWWFDDDGFYRDLALTLAGTKTDVMPTRAPTNQGDWALMT